MQPKFYLPFALALGLTAATGALAAPPAGQLLASQCAQCHGSNGNGPGFDKLSGMSARELNNEMLEMKYRSVPEGIMGRQAHGYTDAQILLIADYLSGVRSGTGTSTSTSTSTGSGAGTGSGGDDSHSVKTEEKKEVKKKEKEKKEKSKTSSTSSKTSVARRD